jgi:S1-C subfamily serine protease
MKHLTFIVLSISVLYLSGCSVTLNTAGRAPRPKEDDFRSVLMLSDGKGHQASGFIVDRNGRQYVVTAKHFAKYMTGRDTVEIFVNGGWVRSACFLVGHGKGELDISVFTFSQPTTSKALEQTPIISSKDTLDAGSEVWSLGFPLGYMFDDPSRNYPYPLIKHGYLSTQNGDPVLYYFDGFCNPGFSGCPVFGVNSQGSLRLIGVVSSRLKESDDPKAEANSGIYIAYSAKYAQVIIDENPIGAMLK